MVNSSTLLKYVLELIFFIYGCKDICAIFKPGFPKLFHKWPL